MNFTIVKTIVTTVAGIGVGQVIEDAVKFTAPESSNVAVKVLRKVGTSVLGYLVADWASEELGNAIESFKDQTEKALTDAVKSQSENDDDDKEETPITEIEEETDLHRVKMPIGFAN